MANNCFGDVVDDNKLDTMERYHGRPKTQEDRAREAMNLIHEGGKDEEATKFVRRLRDELNPNPTDSTLCLIYNATGNPISFVTRQDWTGTIGPAPCPPVINNGQWAAFIHICRPYTLVGSEAAVVYRGANKDGELYDYLFAWSTPYMISAYLNKAYCKIGTIGSFNDRWNDLKDELENSGYSSSDNNYGCLIDASTEKGDAPLFKSTLKTPFTS